MSASVPSVPDPEFLNRLAARAFAADGHPPFSDQSLVDLRTGARELVTIDAVAAALVTPSSAGRVREAEFVVDPDARGRRIGSAILELLLASAPGATTGPAQLLVWAHGDHPAARSLARSHGLVAVRELMRMRLDRLDDHASSPPSAMPDSIRGFRVGVDEEAWLELNARAFVAHPEQGRVTRADLDELFAEPWFQADDFLLLYGAGAVVGYCWLKIDDGRDDEPTGEIYVIGVDPELQGDGIGRRLMLRGLERLRQRGIRSARLYVEADNSAALRLYRSLGFVEDSLDVQYGTLR